MSQHSLQTIQRKIAMNASVTPAEMLLLMRDVILKLKLIEEKLSGLETTTNTRQSSGTVSKRKVSSSKVSRDDDE
jgi:hypothetical protein